MPDEIDPECVRYIREHCVPCWKAASDAQNNIEVSCKEFYLATWTSEDGVKENQNHTLEWTLTLNEETRECLASRIWHAGKEVSAGARTDAVFNPQYHFRAWKDKPSDSFVLADAQRLKPDEQWEIPRDSLNYRCLRAMGHSHSPIEVALWELIDHPDFELVQAKFLTNSSVEDAAVMDSPQSIIMKARCVTSSRRFPTKDAVWEVTLDAKNKWLVSHVEVHQQSEPEELQLTVDYSDREYQSIPFPQRIAFDKQQVRLNYRVKFEYVFDEAKRAERKSEDFLITAYGLPETVLPPSSSAAAHGLSPLVIDYRVGLALCGGWW